MLLAGCGAKSNGFDCFSRCAGCRQSISGTVVCFESYDFFYHSHFSYPVVAARPCQHPQPHRSCSTQHIPQVVTIDGPLVDRSLPSCQAVGCNDSGLASARARRQAKAGWQFAFLTFIPGALHGLPSPGPELQVPEVIWIRAQTLTPGARLLQPGLPAVSSTLLHVASCCYVARHKRLPRFGFGTDTRLVKLVSEAYEVLRRLCVSADTVMNTRVR